MPSQRHQLPSPSCDSASEPSLGHVVEQRPGHVTRHAPGLGRGDVLPPGLPVTIRRLAQAGRRRVSAMNRCARQNPFKCAQPLHREQEPEQAAPHVTRQGPRQRQPQQDTCPRRAERADISLFHADSVGSAGWRVKADFDQCSSQPVVSWPSVALKPRRTFAGRAFNHDCTLRGRAARWSLDIFRRTHWRSPTLRIGQPASLKGLNSLARGWTAAGQKGSGPTLRSDVKRSSTLKAVASERCSS